MRRYIPLFLDTTALVALAVWLGGLAACWMAVRPAALSVPAEAVPTANLLFTATLRRLSAHIEICGLALAAIQWLVRRRYQHDRGLFIADGVRMLVLFMAFFCAEFGRYVLIPALVLTKAPSIYSTLEGLAIAQAVLLIGYGAISCYLQIPRPQPAATAVRRDTMNSPAAPRAAAKQRAANRSRQEHR